jgi:hypothetical protein
MPDELAQLPNLWRGDPRLGKPAHPQQVGEVLRVALVVLDPPVLEGLHPQRVRQVHRRPQLGEGVRGPVPAVGRFQHHLGCFAGAGHDLAQVLRVVADPGGLEYLTGVGHPNQHRPPAVQIHSHDLPALVCSAHWGLLESLA